MSNMNDWGWNQAGHAESLGVNGNPPDDGKGHSGDGHAAALVPARVVRHVHHSYDLVCAPDARVVRGQVSGAFEFATAGPADFPTAGDWVLVEPDSGRIQRLLPRRTAVSRHVAGDETLEQVVVANVDVLLLIFALDGGRGFTIGLLERSLTTAWNSGARPIVVLNKADIADPETQEQALRDVEANAPGVPVHLVSAHNGAGVRDLLEEAKRDETVGMLGKSGVGKSALLNAFARERGADPTAVEGALRRSDSQGRHTTTDKRLYRLPGGPIIADVPGLRELQLWADHDSLEATFPDVESLSAECRFRDCNHHGEPGCRIAEALATGELPMERYERYLDLQRELAFLARKKDIRAAQEEKLKWKQIAEHQRAAKKHRR
ncbi:MAG: ribosome small subunit-dependent GTPase A [Spirochaetaceae bacterium]